MKQGEASQGGGAAPTAIVFFSLPSASSLNLFHLNPLCHSESTLLLITNLFGLPQPAQHCPHHEDDYSCAALHTTAKISCLEQQRYPKFFTITVWIRHGTGDISGCLRSSNLWAECCTQLPQNGHHHFLEGSGCPLAGSGLLFTKFTNVPTPSQYTVELSVPISLQDTLALLPSSCTHSASTNTVLPAIGRVGGREGGEVWCARLMWCARFVSFEREQMGSDTLLSKHNRAQGR